MIKYIRNLFLYVAAQALILQFCANIIIETRFNISPLSYGECFMFSVVVMVFTYNFNIANILAYMQLIAKATSDIGLLQLNANNILIRQLDDINKNIQEGNGMKLDAIKPLDKPTMTPEKIAVKHGVSLESIESQLEMGIKVEMEHTTDKNVAREIALDHLMELPDYYSRLKKVENED